MSAQRLPRWRRILNRFDELGATYAALAGRPGWFVVEWLQGGELWQQVYHPGMPRRKQMIRAVARRAAGKVVAL